MGDTASATPARLNPVDIRAAADPFTDVVVDFYETTAALYDDWAGGVNRRAATRLAQHAAVQSNEVVIDAGCGTGLVTCQLNLDRSSGGMAIGIDIARAMLDIAERGRPANSPIVFTQGRVEELAIPTRSADVVILGQVLSLTPDPAAVVQEARRVLRPGGRIAVAECQRSLMSPVEELFITEMVRISTSRFFRVPRRPEENSRLGEPESLHDLLQEAGFADVQTSNLVMGNHTEDAESFVELMRHEGPWPHLLLDFIGPAGRDQIARFLAGAVRFLRDTERFAYQRPFTFAVARRM